LPPSIKGKGWMERRGMGEAVKLVCLERTCKPRNPTPKEKVSNGTSPTAGL